MFNALWELLGTLGTILSVWLPCYVGLLRSKCMIVSCLFTLSPSASVCTMRQMLKTS